MTITANRRVEDGRTENGWIALLHLEVGHGHDHHTATAKGRVSRIAVAAQGAVAAGASAPNWGTKVLATSMAQITHTTGSTRNAYQNGGADGQNDENWQVQPCQEGGDGLESRGFADHQAQGEVEQEDGSNGGASIVPAFSELTKPQNFATKLRASLCPHL